jgi:hypothetical protein
MEAVDGDSPPGLTALIFVFVIGIFNDAKASKDLRSWFFGKYENSTKGRSSNAVCFISIVQKSNAIQFGRTVTDRGMFLLSKDCAIRDVRDVQTNTACQWELCNSEGFDFRYMGKRSALPDDKKINAKFGYERFCRSVIDAYNVHDKLLAVPKLIHKPNVFTANFWTMSGEKFVAGESDGDVSGSQQPPSGPPESGSKKRNDDCGSSSEPLMPDCFEYAGHRYNKEDVARCAGGRRTHHRLGETVALEIDALALGPVSWDRQSSKSRAPIELREIQYPAPLDFQRQNLRNPARCQQITVSSLRMFRVSKPPGAILVPNTEHSAARS